MHDSISREAECPPVVKTREGGAYRLLELIGKTAGSCLYRASSLETGGVVLVKRLDFGSMLPESIASFHREYASLQSLDVAGVLKPIALIDESSPLMMVLQECDGELFETALRHQHFDWPVALRLACQLARILAELHARHLTHHDMRPVNWLLSPARTLCLADLSRATHDAAQVMAVGSTVAANRAYDPDWAYVSPEQTGRLNCAVDYRTDFYSLGVMLYRVLTGQLPFHGNNALEWAYCHIARLARPPGELCPEIPAVISNIVMKLLAKMPQERYQCARGLLHDLECCLAEWEMRNTITPFALGKQDWSGLLQMPSRLVGREREIRQLRESFDAVATSGRAALLLISGAAGIGKSVLAQELQQPTAARHGYYISGKFDQYQGDIPYVTVTQAFRELVQQILTESEESIAAWRRQIQAAVDANGQLIVDVLPQVELIIGPQVPVPELPPAEAKNRFLMVFQQFIGVFAQQDHPLTLVLDDLQWADVASLKLLHKLLTSPGQRFLLVVGAYRDNEVAQAGPAHPLTVALGEMSSHGAEIKRITLAPLSEAAFGTFLDEVLQSGGGATAPLAQLIYQKTAGNPFFMIQFIGTLTEQGMIAFDAAGKTWRWNLDRIKAQGYTDNVADLMVAKLAQLPAAALAVLQQLACLGSTARESMLATVCGQPEAELRAALASAVDAGLVTLSPDGTIGFLHDRIQEAAYLSIPASGRAALHLQIGRRLLAGKTPAQIEETVFPVVGQFNRGADSISDVDEKALLRHLDFLAGKKAKAAIAYASACNFLNRAFGLLPSDAWQAQYEECIAITRTLSECEYLVGNFPRAEQLANLILANARTSAERAQVYQLRMQLYQMAGRFDDAVNTVVEAVRLFDIAFPAPGAEIEAAVEAEVSEISAALQGRAIADIALAPRLTDNDMGMLIALLVEAIAPTYSARPDYFAFVTVTAVKLSLRYGHTEDSCLAYSVYGLVLLARRGDISAACDFSEMALQLNEKLGGRRLKGRLLAVHAATFCPWKDYIARATTLFDQAFAACLEVGDLVYANYTGFCYFWPMLQQGLPLDEVSLRVRGYAAFARDSRNDPVCHAIRFQQQLVANLKGETRGPASLDDDGFSAAAALAALEKSRFGAGIYITHVIKQIVAFIQGDYAGALAAAQRGARKSHHSGGVMIVDFAHHFYYALTLAALYPQASGEEQRKFATLLAGERERHKLWAGHCPQNFLNCHALIDAEIARIEGRATEAEHLYERAIGSARENAFIQNEAIASELASRFYRARGFALIADAYLRQARDAYLRWGAAGKAAQLDALYPQLREGCVPVPLDVLSVCKASQAISSQVVLGELTDTLLHIVLENAGAQTGALVLPGDKGFLLAAQANVDRTTAQVHVCAWPVAAEAALPASILNYVRRSRELVLLPDLTQSNRFSADPYFARHHPKTVLCLPVLRQDVMVGLLYLENELVAHAFSSDRVTVLKLLASQAAISLENAQLYANLQQENKERRRAEEALRESERNLRQFVDILPTAVYTCDASGAITSYNQSAVALWGRAPALGEDAEHYCGSHRIFTREGDFLPHAQCPMAEVLHSAMPVSNREIVVERPDGSRRSAMANIIVRRDPYGNLSGAINCLTDITDLKKAQQALRESEQKYRLVWEASSDALILMDQESVIRLANPSVADVFGYAPDALVGQKITLLQPERLREASRQGVRHYLESGIKKLAWRHAETIALHRDGHEFPVEMTLSHIESEGQLLFASFIRDISERKRSEEALREKEARIRRLVDSNIIGVIFWDVAGAITDANDAFLQLVGYSRADLSSGKIRWREMTPPEYREANERAIQELMRTGACAPFEKEYICKDGHRVPVVISMAMLEGSQEQGVGFVLDLTARKEAEEQVRHMADHDALTGLPNRTLLQDRMQQAVATAHRNERQVAILFIDLDYFKNINDSLGHQTGDVVLQMTAQRLQNCLREGDSVARLGGDEFVLILPLLSDSNDVARVAQKALDTLAQPFFVEGHQLHVSCSIGISLYPEDGTDVETLMRTADTAMYHAKESGRDNYKFFTTALNQAAQQRLDIGTRLRQALINDEFVLHYQPQVDMQSGAIFSAEALLRWQPAGSEPISCGSFIANAEESGLIVPMGEWALRQACRQLKIWHDSGYPELKMAVNLSPRQLEQAGFCQLVGQILDETGVPSWALELEITEGILLKRNEANLAVLMQFSDMGIQLSVDDFGTGYSSLSYLQRFPVHALKIDQSFVRDIGSDAKDTALVTAIIAMANSLDLKVIAEGVETVRQAEFLMSHGCNAGQGFYYGKALPAEMLMELFRMNPMPLSPPTKRIGSSRKTPNH